MIMISILYGCFIQKDGAIPGNMDRVVNITVSPEVLKTMLEQREPWLGQQQQAEELHFTESTGQGRKGRHKQWRC